VLERRVRLVDSMGTFGGGRLLDIGCGNGAQTVRWLDRFDAVVGLDVVAEHLHVFDAVLATTPGQACTTRLYDGDRMPFEAASFDAAVSIETLEHVADEARTLREVHRVLRPGGLLMISVPNKWWIFETHGARLPLLPWNRVPFFSWLPAPLHQRWARARIYTRSGIEALLRRHGFEVESSRYLAAPMDAARPAALARLLRATVFRGPATRWPILSTSIFVRARRA
jgi:ubiquinone/menaquinone biosynthesis C-methylase UbiE